MDFNSLHRNARIQGKRDLSQRLQGLQSGLMPLLEHLCTKRGDRCFLDALRGAEAALTQFSAPCHCCAGDVAKLLAAVREVISCVEVGTGDLKAFTARLEIALNERFCTTEITLPAQDVAFTHGIIDNRFAHGEHASLGLDTLINKLRDGLDPLATLSLTLNAVFFHGRLRSLNNRRLYCLKQAECMVNVRVLPLVSHHEVTNTNAPKRRRTHKVNIIEMFCQASSTDNDGQRVVVRVPPRHGQVQRSEADD